MTVELIKDRVAPLEMLLKGLRSKTSRLLSALGDNTTVSVARASEKRTDSSANVRRDVRFRSTPEDLVLVLRDIGGPRGHDVCLNIPWDELEKLINGKNLRYEVAEELRVAKLRAAEAQAEV